MRMREILWVMGVCVLMQGSLSSAGETARGCILWSVKGQTTDVCCDICHPGNHRVKPCGPDPEQLCTPCEPETFIVDPDKYRCTRCTQCVGAQVLVKECTSSTDTVCGCDKGLRCGDDLCSFCVKECEKGQEPATKRSCRPCPDGTFNDQIHQKCKPWSTRCPDQHIVAKGDAFSDVKCANISVATVNRPEQEVHTVPAWPLILCTIFVGTFLIVLIAIVFIKMIKKRKNTKKLIITPPIIRTPTDDPRTLIAIECSFHEAQQEQGSSSESLASKDSTSELIR